MEAFCVGLVPSYATIGLWAPAIMVVLRMIQGFSTGGEYGGATSIPWQSAPSRRRGFLGSFLEFGTLAGFFAGRAVDAEFLNASGDDQMGSWGWRLPFAVAAPLGLVGVYLRSKLEDTPVFRELEKCGGAEGGPGSGVQGSRGRIQGPILRLGGLVIALNVVNYTLLTYMPTYLEQTIGLSSSHSLVVPIIGMLTMMVFLPFTSRISGGPDRPQADVVDLARQAIRRRGADVPADVDEHGGRVIAFAVLGLLYVPPAVDHFGDLPGDVPTQVRYGRPRSPTTCHDVTVRRYGARGQRLAGRADGRQPGAGVLP